MATVTIKPDVRPSRAADRTERRDAGRADIRVLRTSVRGATTTDPGERPLTIRHNVLRDALVEALGTPPGGGVSIGPRLQILLNMGLRRADGPAPGRGRGHRNGLADALDAALAFTLQRAFAPPSAIVAMMLENRGSLDARWTAAARGAAASVTVEIDALRHAGREGMRTGRFSEDPVGTLTLVGEGTSARRPRSAPAPRITIDLAGLHRTMTGCLRRAGVPKGELEHAVHLLAARTDWDGQAEYVHASTVVTEAAGWRSPTLTMRMHGSFTGPRYKAKVTKPNPSWPPELAGMAPAILPRICATAGWTHDDLLHALAAGLRTRGIFNSLTAAIPSGVPKLPAGFPVFEVRPVSGTLRVELTLGSERVSCAGGGGGLVTMGIILPETLMTGACGRPLAEAVHHDLLDSPDFVITAIRRPPWHAHCTVAFTMPDCRFPH